MFWVQNKWIEMIFVDQFYVQQHPARCSIFHVFTGNKRIQVEKGKPSYFIMYFFKNNSYWLQDGSLSFNLWP